MLEEYFKIGVNEHGLLCTLPDLLPGYTPDPSGLPLFLLRLVSETDWEDETNCFKSICTELGYFYSRLPFQYGNQNQKQKQIIEKPNQLNTVSTEIKTITDLKSHDESLFEELFISILFPGIKTHLIPPTQCASDGSTIVQLAALEQLYKIFERC